MVENIFCSESAFAYFRTPPQVLAALPELPIARDRTTRANLHKEPAFEEIFGVKAHRLVLDQGARPATKSFKTHIWPGDLPSDAIWDVPVIDKVTSPLFTLLLLARGHDVLELAIAMHEMCGKFCVYEPTGECAKKAAVAGHQSSPLI